MVAGATALDQGQGSLLLVLAVTVAVSVVLAMLLVAVLRRLAKRWDVSVLSGRLWQSPVVVIVVLGAVQSVLAGSARNGWTDELEQLLGVMQICGVAWLLIVLVRTVEKAALDKYPSTDLADEKSRHVRTKVTLMQRVATSLIITVAVGAILWTIPEVRAVGATLLASAGVLSIIAGLAAQTSLANIFAGVQIAFTDGIRVGDIVSIEALQGRIDEITLTYVVVEVWDGTRLILPCTYFTTTPFRNWSHSAGEVLGEVLLDCDWPAPIDAIRSELTRLLRESPRWDGRHAALLVAKAEGQALQLVAQFSAPADQVELLRFDVREGLVTFVRAHHPDAWPRLRTADLGPPTAEPKSSRARP
jgi:small-conductance mechanosensitive channel